jgi:hypothetical protein
MMVEQRTYTLQIGKTREYLALYEQQGLQLQRSVLGRLVGYYVTVIGPLNEVVHLWAYENFEERSTRREALMADPAWCAYVERVGPLLVRQEVKILQPAPFFDLHWMTS